MDLIKTRSLDLATSFTKNHIPYNYIHLSKKQASLPKSREDNPMPLDAENVKFSFE